MKKLLALVLAVVLLVPAMLTSCGTDEEIKGAEIQMFLTTLPQRLDPAAVYSDADTMKVMGLLYEGLTTLNEKGKVEKAIAKDWEYEIDERDNLMKLEIELTKTRWSDGIILDADDFIYAWTRILLPENNNSNAALLYPIYNAQEVKEGLCSVNDLGLYAVKDDLLQIVFEPSFIGPDHSKKEVKENIENKDSNQKNIKSYSFRSQVRQQPMFQITKSSNFNIDSTSSHKPLSVLSEQININGDNKIPSSNKEESKYNYHRIIHNFPIENLEEMKFSKEDQSSVEKVQTEETNQVDSYLNNIINKYNHNNNNFGQRNIQNWSRQIIIIS